jgi:hypothetical protein
MSTKHLLAETCTRWLAGIPSSVATISAYSDIRMINPKSTCARACDVLGMSSMKDQIFICRRIALGRSGQGRLAGLSIHRQLAFSGMRR